MLRANHGTKQQKTQNMNQEVKPHLPVPIKNREDRQFDATFKISGDY